MSEARREKLEDIIVEKSDGEINNITNELFATSVDELIKWENIDLHNKLDIVQKNYLQQQEIIDIKNKEINDLILEPLYNKIGFKNRFKLIFFKKIGYFLGMVFLAIVVATEKMIDYKYKEFTWIVVVIPTVGQFILDIANKKLQGALERKFLMKQVKK